MNIVAWQTKSFPKFLFVKTFKGPTTLKTSLSEDDDENVKRETASKLFFEQL